MVQEPRGTNDLMEHWRRFQKIFIWKIFEVYFRIKKILPNVQGRNGVFQDIVFIKAVNESANTQTGRKL